jgi:uncharacterized protein YndB with AHSA1/START domain
VAVSAVPSGCPRPVLPDLKCARLGHARRRLRGVPIARAATRWSIAARAAGSIAAVWMRANGSSEPWRCKLEYVTKTTRVVLTCDLHADGTEADTTIRLDNGTARYELDLCQTHLAELTGAGRRLRPRRRTGGAASATKAANKKAAAKTRRRGGGGRDTAAVREWARAHGYTVSDRGRIPRRIRDAFTASE